VIFDLATREGLAIEERGFSVAESLTAREAFITAATTLVMPVVAIDGKRVGDGRPGAIATRLRALFHGIAETAPAWSGASHAAPNEIRG
jgi:D-alanine transaminase